MAYGLGFVSPLNDVPGALRTRSERTGRERERAGVGEKKIKTRKNTIFTHTGHNNGRIEEARTSAGIGQGETKCFTNANVFHAASFSLLLGRVVTFPHTLFLPRRENRVSFRNSVLIIILTGKLKRLLMLPLCSIYPAPIGA